MNEKKLNEARTKIAGFIRNKRIALNMNQQGLADKCNMSVGTISRMENGHFWLGMKQFVLICDALEIELSVLLE